MNKGTSVVDRLANIPPFPQIAVDVLQLLKDPHASAKPIVALVEKDVALTSAVLKLANSGLYGRRRSIGSVRAALRALGSDAFSQAVFRASLKDYLGAAVSPADLNRCWAHSIACAEISKILATGLNFPPDVALAAGLLHDLGRFGLALADPGKHRALLAGEGYVDVLDSERALFGIDHTEAGRMLAERFHFPDDFRVIAGRHHDHIRSDEPDMLSVVSVACSVASAVGFSVVPSSLPRSLDDVIRDAPRPMRGRISPDVEGWTTALLNALGSS